MMMDRFELLEHTADIGIAASAGSWPALLEQLALGWRQIVCGDSPIARTITLERSISGEDREELLVNLLNELSYLLETRNFIPADLQIDEMPDGELTLYLQGENCDPVRHQLQQEVKAATYHQLQILYDFSGWRAQVYLDI